jgi:elongation factor G
VIPTFCGSALKYIGVQRLLNGVVDYLPNPTQVPEIQGTHPDDKEIKLTRPHDPEAPFAALVFKVVSDQHGDLTYARIYSGIIDKGQRVLNSNNGKREIVSRIFEMHAKERIARDTAHAGEIVAFALPAPGGLVITSTTHAVTALFSGLPLPGTPT